ncbi:MAG: hypothetical protein IJQ23_07965 [Clostridia bacterium]|nr:hypothetical protein [Clostridia bacterium]
MELYIECCKSKDKESVYHALKVKLPFRSQASILTMEKETIYEIANITPSTLYAMKAGDILKVGIISPVKGKE